MGVKYRAIIHYDDRTELTQLIFPKDIGKLNAEKEFKKLTSANVVRVYRVK